MNLKFAFAVNNENRFEKKHFGDADKFLIYRQKGSGLDLLSEAVNHFKQFDDEQRHGSKRKGKAIINFLKSQDVQVLVSKQFGKNIKLVNEYFIPVIIAGDIDREEEVLQILYKHLHWLEEEWENKNHGYKLFTIREGILKKPID